MSAPKLRQVNARVPDTLVEALDVAAECSGRTRADLIREALERYLIVTLAALARKDTT